MKGVVFTEFLELVEDKFGFEMMDDIIVESDLGHDGAYTAVGTYHHSEMVKLVSTLSQRSQVPVPDLLKTFGQHLFKRFSITYPDLFDGVSNSFDFLLRVHNHIHVEVKKLYPEAELPDINASLVDDDHLVLHYQSTRPFADFAEGLVLGCVAFFEDNMCVSVSDKTDDNTRCTIQLSKAA